MKRRRPPFTLVLATLGVALVALVALTTRHGASPHHGPPSLAVAGPARECMTAQASGGGVAHATVSAHARVTLPVSVTERIQTPAGTVTATGTEKIVDSAKVERPVSITEHEVAVRRACARGSTPRRRSQRHSSTLTPMPWRQAALRRRRARAAASKFSPSRSTSRRSKTPKPWRWPRPRPPSPPSGCSSSRNCSPSSRPAPRAVPSRIRGLFLDKSRGTAGWGAPGSTRPRSSCG